MKNSAVLNLSCPDMLPSEREVSLRDSDLSRQGKSLDGFGTISFDPSTPNVDGSYFVCVFMHSSASGSHDCFQNNSNVKKRLRSSEKEVLKFAFGGRSIETN
ncbi:hypothetical protein NPIL_183271 [Nephila pilipes]|uniref:Uncharacterized protein n=1 Tax=Nephila pilipes TaxID=299642 RepID=A0A8X6TAD9_NEPPI|nr:hypothetical protein NPIL_183271 [Nephila pilipes]